MLSNIRNVKFIKISKLNVLITGVRVHLFLIKLQLSALLGIFTDRNNKLPCPLLLLCRGLFVLRRELLSRMLPYVLTSELLAGLSVWAMGVPLRGLYTFDNGMIFEVSIQSGCFFFNHGELYVEKVHDNTYYQTLYF